MASRAPEGPVAQLLIYPVTDFVTERRSHRLFADGFFLTMADCDAFFRCYAGSAGPRHDDPRVSPLLAAGMSGRRRAIVPRVSILCGQGDRSARAEAAGAR